MKITALIDASMCALHIETPRNRVLAELIIHSLQIADADDGTSSVERVNMRNGKRRQD